MSLWQGDAWDMAANQHLLSHILCTLAENPKRYGRPMSYHSLKNTTSKTGDASAEFIANVSRLFAAKNAWAADMRDLATLDGEVPVKVQREVWDDYIGKAERACATNQDAA